LSRKYVDKEELEHRIRRWAELEEEARRIRREMADWEFIEKQEPRIKEALKYYIEKGDIRRASMLAGVDLETFRDLLRKARIPVIV
jgi:predicted HTH domain antitoxin